MTQPPPYPPQPGAPQGYPQQPAPPPAYLGGGAAQQPAPYPAQPYPPAGYAAPTGPGLPPPPPTKPRTIGFTMGLLTAIVLIAFVVVVALVTG